MVFRFSSLIVMVAGSGVLGCAVDVDPNGTFEQSVGTISASRHGSRDFSVAFADCTESIGVTLVSTEAAAALVPSTFVLAGSGTPVTPLVVRTAHCQGIFVDGHRGQSGTVVQVGAVVVPPDGTGDINNYTLWYYTDDQRLQSALDRVGLRTQKVHIGYQQGPLESGQASLSVRLKRPADPSFALDGTVNPVTVPAGAFVANWWSQSDCLGTLKLSTEVPVIAVGQANLVATTKPGSALAALLGATTTNFPLLQQFNAFQSAEMRVSARD